MATIHWTDEAQNALRKLPKETARRIARKVDGEIKANPQHFLEPLVGIGYSKIRVGDYRLFVIYDCKTDTLHIEEIHNRRDAYK